MPKFLENKLKKEYGEKSAIPYKVMNSIGAMHGNKETAKGAAMERKHEADMKVPKMTKEPMREMRIEMHRGPGNKLTGFTVHHSMVPKPSKSMAFHENTTHSFPFAANEHEAMMDHVHEHTAGQLGGGTSETASAAPPKESAGEMEEA